MAEEGTGDGARALEELLLLSRRMAEDWRGDRTVGEKADSLLKKRGDDREKERWDYANAEGGGSRMSEVLDSIKVQPVNGDSGAWERQQACRGPEEE